MARAPMFSEHWESVSGVQLLPPSVVFHTPPLAAPMYIVFAFTTAIAVTRPDAVYNPPKPEMMELGPSATHPAVLVAAGLCCAHTALGQRAAYCARANRSALAERRMGAAK